MTQGLRVSALGKAYGDRVVIDGASFEIERGETVCLTGDNGAGKSTLLRCLVGLAGFEGTAQLDGIDVRTETARRRIGYVPQSPALVETATVGETLDFFARLRGSEPELQALDGFLPPLDARVGHLSGGQRQRVALAIGFLDRPDLLLLDEPTANLDDRGRTDAREMISAAAGSGASVLIVSPAAIDLVTIVDRIVMLRDGRLVAADRLYSSIDPAGLTATEVPA